MSLHSYRHKRHFKHTKEPFGKKSKKNGKLLYVIQKHAATRLHYDFRLELNGTLKSWAVPKGPSKDPSVKRLAVHVEDHPIEYGSFEGTIPKGNYGAGKVEIWDTGSWECLDKDPNKAYRQGNLTFIVKGKRLKGAWKLIQIKSDPKNWLLMKISEQHVTKNQSIPKTISPELCTLVKEPPSGNEWLHEIKFDGYRLMTYIKNSHITLFTRNNHDWTKKFPAIQSELAKLKLKDAILDGELVAINDDDQFDFQLLQNSIHNKDTSNLFYYLFDIVFSDGQNLADKPLLERKAILKEILSKQPNHIIFSDYLIGNGIKAYKEACRAGLEGIISKHVDSPYTQARSHYWLKSKCVNRQEFVVGGYTKPKGARSHFGSLLLGINSPARKLIYCGHVGTGFNEQTLNQIAKQLSQYKSKEMPFNTLPPEAKNTVWVKPKLIIEVEFRGWTQEKILRQASFKGIRHDKKAKEITMEKTEIVQEAGITNPTKILYPEQGITKLEVAEYYTDIHEWILPYIINRPLTLVRCPNGYEKQCFYQKHLDKKIKSIYTLKIKKDQDSYFYIKDKNGLLELVQLGTLEIHPWGSRIDNINKPDLIIFDLDPGPEVSWNNVVKAALLLRAELSKLNLISFVKTTGGKGLHVCIPIKRLYTWEEVKLFSHTFVEYIVSLKPNAFISVMTKSKRKGKIFIDYLRNQRGATAVAAYSTRAKNGAPVSTPLDWDELSTKVKSDFYTLENLPHRLEKLRKDPWEDFF